MIFFLIKADMGYQGLPRRLRVWKSIVYDYFRKSVEKSEHCGCARNTFLLSDPRPDKPAGLIAGMTSDCRWESTTPDYTSSSSSSNLRIYMNRLPHQFSLSSVVQHCNVVNSYYSISIVMDVIKWRVPCKSAPAGGPFLTE